MANENNLPTTEPGSAIRLPQAATASRAPSLSGAADAARTGGQTLAAAATQGADALRTGADRAAAAATHGAETAADASVAAGEAMRRNAAAFAETQRAFVERAAHQFEEVSRKLAESAKDTSESLRGLATMPQAGLGDLQQGLTGLVEGVMRTNLRAAQQLFEHANPVALVELQQRFVQEYLDTLMTGTATIVRATRRVADETLRPIEQHVEQRRGDVAHKQAAE